MQKIWNVLILLPNIYLFQSPKDFVYELDKQGFTDRRDWMVNNGQAKIINKTPITLKHIASLCETYKPKGSGIFKKAREIVLKFHAHKIFDNKVPVKISPDEIKWQNILSKHAEKV